jgi:hypothetical protein
MPTPLLATKKCQSPFDKPSLLMVIEFFQSPQKRANENVLVVAMLVTKIFSCCKVGDKKFWSPQGFVIEEH